VQSVSVTIEPPQFLAGWRPEAGALFLPVLSESRVGEQAAVRVGIQGQPIRATVFGRVGLVRRVGRPTLPPGVELLLDRASLAAAGFLACAARGEPVSFRERAPRYVAAEEIQVIVGRQPIEVRTVNLAEGGCAVPWPGPLPLVGDVLEVRLKGGLFPPVARAIVCWNQPGTQQDRSVGLRLVLDGRPGRAWRKLVDGVARSGARAT